MASILDIQFTRLLYEGTNSLVYEGLPQLEDLFNKKNTDLIIKILKKKYPTEQEIARFKYEYHLLKKLQGKGTVRVYELVSYEKTYAILMEKFGTYTLSELEACHSFSIQEFLEIALKIIEALELIHEEKIIHKDINPSNILIDEKTQAIRIIDFGVSSLLPREEPDVQNIKMLEGTLAYMSPEQTGRMNRGIDYRSDFYSLGILFYEMITGVLPFVANDPLEMIHAHIAKIPKTPHEINASIPPVLSEIIVKLIAKNPEDRYQNIFSLKTDLQNCLNQLNQLGKIKPFLIGKYDISNQFLIPEKLYGRNKEWEQLMYTFDRTSHGKTELLLVCGYSGIGKSRLVHEVHKPIVAKQGYFISGKYDQFKRNIPYTSIIQAFQELVHQILTEKDEKIQEIKKNILSSVKENGQLLIDVIPILSTIIGSQKPLSNLGLLETQNRFILVFKRFVQSLATKNHPLTIFLDDLQWADSSSLALLDALLSDKDSYYFLIIAAYRNNEVDATHPLSLFLEKLKKKSVLVTSLNLEPLSILYTKQLIADTLHLDIDDIGELADICYKKTQGNPFFLMQFFTNLHEENLIQFNPKQKKWYWDIQKIEEKDYTDNVVEFIAKKIRNLSKKTQSTLKLAACLGNRFDLTLLSTIVQQTETQTADDLWQALQEGFLLPANDQYKYVSNHGEENLITYKFPHDRLQQAAYSLIAEKDKPNIHLMIGRLLLKHTFNTETQENLLTIINHLNQGIKLVTSKKEKLFIANLNLMAAQKAKASIAYQPAFDYIRIGIHLLDKNSWKTSYSLTLFLYIEGVEITYLLSNFDTMEQYSDVVFKNAISILDKIRVYETKIGYLARQNKFSESIHLGLEALTLFNIKLPESPKNIQVLISLIKNKIRLSGKSIDALYRLPISDDINWKAAANLISSIIASAFLSNPNLLVLLVLKLIELTLNKGTTAESSYGYALYGVLLAGKLNNPKKGYEYGELNRKILEKLHVESQKAWMLVPLYCLISHWTHHLKSSQKALIDNFYRCTEVGNLEYAGYFIANYIFTNFFCGYRLLHVSIEAKKYAQLLLKISEKTSLQYIKPFWRISLQLQGYSSEDIFKEGANFDDEETINLLKKSKDNVALCLIYTTNLIKDYLLGNYQKAYERFDITIFYLKQVIGAMFIIPTYFFIALTSFAYYNEAQAKKKKIF